MKRCKKALCLNTGICGKESMSTPAENTRSRSSQTGHHALNGTASEKIRSKGKRQEQQLQQTCSERQKREKRQVLKLYNLQKVADKRNQLVNKWLVSSQGICVKGLEKRSKDESVKTVGYDKESLNSKDKSTNKALFDEKWEQYYKQITTGQVLGVYRSQNSQNSSEVSEVVLNIKSSVKTTGSSFKTAQCVQESPLHKMLEPVEVDSIIVGQSAMSGKSSTARRRLNKAAKLRKVSQMHGKQVADYFPEQSEPFNDDAVELLAEHVDSNTYSQSGRESIERERQSAETHRSEERKNGNEKKEMQGEQGLQADDTEGSIQEENERQGETQEKLYQTIMNGDSEEGPEPENKDEDAINPDIIAAFRKRLDEEDKTVFYDMFELIITKISTVQNNMREVRAEQLKINNKIEVLNNTIDVISQTVDDLDMEVEEVNDGNVKLIETTIKIEDKLFTVEKGLAAMMNRTNKGSFILNGVIMKKEESAKSAVKNFLKNQMEIENEIELVSAHKMGKAKYAPIWFRLQDPDEVPILFKHISNLKDKKNANDRKYKLREFTTELVKEEKIRQQDIQMENGRLPESHKLDLSYQKGEMYVNEVKYDKEINAPRAKDMLLMTKEQENILEQIRMHQGPTIKENDSTFEVYMAQVDSFEAIAENYQAVVREHLSASTVMVGYRLFGSQHHLLQDYCDNNEHGGGRAILNVLKDAKIWNVAVFIVRYHNGPHLGKRRFEIIEDLVKQVIATFPNPLNYGTLFRDQLTLKSLNEATERPVYNNKEAGGIDTNTRGRGGVRGRGSRGGRPGHNRPKYPRTNKH